MSFKNTGVLLGLLTIALSACGGGGGSSPGGGGPPPTTIPPTPTPGAPTTNASGKVVDDANGAALAGVSVKLMPWGGGPGTCSATPAPAAITPESDGCPTPLPAPIATTDASGNFTLANAPNGHYLLIIGSDTVMPVPAGYTTPAPCGTCPTPTAVPGTPAQATVHDNVTLTGGNETLNAPTLPTVPAGYTAPAWETNGSYRLATLDALKEMPCYVAWQYQRNARSLPEGSVDEWLVENVRANNAYAQTLTSGGKAYPLTTGGTSSSGGTSCIGATLPSAVFSASFLPEGPYALDVRALWFGGRYALYSAFGGTNNEAAGLAEFPIDPRSFTDPLVANWP